MSLEIERVMWSKENKEAAEQEETQVEAAPKKSSCRSSKAITPAPKPVTRVETPAMAPKPTPVPTPKPVSVEAAVELVTPAPVKSSPYSSYKARDSTGCSCKTEAACFD